MTHVWGTDGFPHPLNKGKIQIGPVRLLLIFLVGTASGNKVDPPANRDLTDLLLEELMSVEVTSVSKKKQKLSESAAAIFVITQEDIRRSGVTSIPEVLRMISGLQVVRNSKNQCDISTQGFNERFTNKLLVLINGRTVSNPLFAGVTWETQDTILEDIERIEVIRGPGGSLWGVNGVNTIITKQAQDIQGVLVSGVAGTEEGTVSIRQGGNHGSNLHYHMDVDEPINSNLNTTRENVPHHQGSVRSLISLPNQVEFDSWIRIVDKLSASNIANYVELDLRLGWKPIPSLDLSLVGKNLLDNHHPEASPSLFLATQPTEV